MLFRVALFVALSCARPLGKNLENNPVATSFDLLSRLFGMRHETEAGRLRDQVWCCSPRRMERNEGMADGAPKEFQ